MYLFYLLELLMRIKKLEALWRVRISFFTRFTLFETVICVGWKVTEIRQYIFKDKKVDKSASVIAPYLYVVVNDLFFKYPKKKIDEWKDDLYYKNMLQINN